MGLYEIANEFECVRMLYVSLCVFYGVLCDCVWLCIASGLDVFFVCLGLYCVLRVWVGVCF